MGYAKVKGRFADFKGTVRYDENNLENTSISLLINIESINTDLDWRDNDLKSDAWFDAEKFPVMTFLSKKIIPRGMAFDVVGDLTIRDVTKEIIITMNPPSGVLKDTGGDSQVIFTGEFTIDRTDYGVAGERWSKIKENIAGVGNDVAIEISILGKRLNERNLTGFFRNEESAHSKIYKSYNESGIEAALSTFDNLKETDERLSMRTMRMVGRLLVLNNKIDDAIRVYQKNSEATLT
jgi:polyisoprenoid-binding protein YceI